MVTSKRRIKRHRLFNKKCSLLLTLSTSELVTEVLNHPVHVGPSLTYRQNLLSSLKTTKCHSTLQLTPSHHQSSRFWQCHNVNDSLAKGTHDLSPAASRRFPTVLGDTAGATCAQISSPEAVGWPLLLTQNVDPDVCLYYAAIQNLVFGYGNVPQTTAENSDTPPDILCPTCAAICRYVHPASHRPTIRSCSNGWSCSVRVTYIREYSTPSNNTRTLILGEEI